METLGWGILGTGKIAKVLAEAIPQSETGRLVAVGSRSAESAEAFGGQFGVPNRYATYDGVLSDPAVDAVYISLPNNLHAEWTINCAQAGKHILCEKPLGMNYAEVMAMLEAVREHDVCFLEAFMYRASRQTRKLVEIVKSGAIGDIRLIQANFAYNMGPGYDNIRLRKEAGGGGIMDVGCYTMSMARLIAGAANGNDFADLIDISGQAHIGPVSRVDEWAVATVKFPGDILATLTCGCECAADYRVVIYGSKGSILVENPWFPGRTPDATSKLIVTSNGKVEDIVIPAGVPLYANEVDVLAHSIGRREAISPAMTFADSLGNQKALDIWRASVGLVWDGENDAALATPVSRQPLKRRFNAFMPYGRIAGIDKPVSRLIIGSMVVHTAKRPLSFALLDHFYEIGGTAIDTAYVYGGGASEPVVGEWIRARGLRDEIVLIAKGGANATVNTDQLEWEMTESLDRLKLDYADIYMMHRDNVNVPVGEFVEFFNNKIAKGVIKSYGGSNWSTSRLHDANTYAREHNLVGMAASSPNFSLATWNEPMWADCVSASDAESKQWYGETQMPLLAWSSQASGLFTGRFSRADINNAAARDVVRVWFNEPNFKRLRRANEVAAKHGCTALQIALAYVLAQPLNIFALVGPQTLEETRTSAAALKVVLTPEELAYLNLETPQSTTI